MNFKDVTLKNFTHNIKNYIAYFLCNTFTIMLFFVYASLMFNKGISAIDGGEPVKYIAPMSLAAILLFSVFFIIYTHTNFIKSRSKEFGVFMTLGMTKKDISKIANTENIFIMIVSMIVGMSLGYVFSRLFQLASLTALGIKNIQYYLGIETFIATAIVYITIFMTVIIITNQRLKKMDIATLIKDNRVKQNEKKNTKKNVIMGIIGIILCITSIILLYSMSVNKTKDTDFKIVFMFIVIMFLGVYLLISNIGCLVITYIKRSKNYYLRMLPVNRIDYRYKKNKNIMFLLSVISGMIILLVASPFSLLQLTKDIVEMTKYDFTYVVEGSQNEIKDKKAEIAELNKDGSIVKEDYFQFILLEVETNEGVKKVAAMPQSSCEILNDHKITLEDNEVQNLIITWIPGDRGLSQGSTYEFINTNSGKKIKLSIDNVYRNESNIGTFKTESLIVMTDKTFDEVAENSEELSYMGGINFKDWESSDNIVDNIEKIIGDNGYKVDAAIRNYHDYKSGYGGMLFITSILGVLFFVASATVICFKQFSEFDEMKRTYNKLYKIGLKKREMIKIFAGELKVVFFTPIIFGTFIGYTLIYMITMMVGGGNIVEVFLKNASIILGLYILLQAAIYIIIKKCMLNKL